MNRRAAKRLRWYLNPPGRRSDPARARRGSNLVFIMSVCTLYFRRNSVRHEGSCEDGARPLRCRGKFDIRAYEQETFYITVA